MPPTMQQWVRHAKPVTLGAALCLAVGAGLAAARYQNVTPLAPQAPTPMGDTLPTVSLLSPDGRRVSLATQLAHRAAVIYIFGRAECTSCSNLPLEFKVLRADAPGIRPLLIVSGSTVQELGSTVSQLGLGANVLIDERRALLHALGFEKEPLVLLADSTGRILLVDSRRASRAAQYP